MLKSLTTISRSLKVKMPLVKGACLIIGDEVLNGKITDTNSRFFAKYCYELGIHLREIVTVGDEHEQIVDTIRRLKADNDFIVTSGGIGPTHDDITYESVASSFGLECKLDEECQRRMRRISDPEARHQGDALKAFYRMATLPNGPNVENYYVHDDLWVPIVSIEKKVYVLPGVPQLFERLLTGFTNTLKGLYGLEKDTAHEYQRYFVKTPMSESEISMFLAKIQKRGTEVSKEIKIGSYPHFGMGFNTVSILGLKKDDAFLKQIVKETIQTLKGTEISATEEQQISDSR